MKRPQDRGRRGPSRRYTGHRGHGIHSRRGGRVTMRPYGCVDVVDIVTAGYLARCVVCLGAQFRGVTLPFWMWTRCGLLDGIAPRSSGCAAVMKV